MIGMAANLSMPTIDEAVKAPPENPQIAAAIPVSTYRLQFNSQFMGIMSSDNIW